MCIVLGQVKDISQTKIFVGPNKDKTKQLTVYANNVDSFDENLMILPIPKPETLELHKVSYKYFFSDCSSSVSSLKRFQYSYHMYSTRSMPLTASLTLPVFEYGSYLVSIAPTLEDLFRLDMSVFDVPPGIVDFFAKYYDREFGYLCCKLKEGKHDYEPVYYSHALHSSGKLYVPTLHYHNHGSQVHTEEADWDHMIYSVGTTEGANLGYRSLDENKVEWKKLPKEFRWSNTTPVRCAEVTGHHKNHDMAFQMVTA